jgi:hypothetical protein
MTELQDLGRVVPLWQATFLTPLELEYIDGVRYRVTTAFEFESAVLDRIIAVPAGFVTDFASVPRAFWELLPPTGRYGKAAVVHDRLYHRPSLATKAEADAVFLEAMTVLGVNVVTRQIMYRAVSWFGGSSYQGGL